MITNITRNSLKMSLFPRDFEDAKSIKTYEKKKFSGDYLRDKLVSEGTSRWAMKVGAHDSWHCTSSNRKSSLALRPEANYWGQQIKEK